VLGLTRTAILLVGFVSERSRSPSFGTAVAERDSECTGFLSEGTRGTLECSRDGFDRRFVF